MIITRRRVGTVEEVTVKLDVLARENHIEAHVYTESAAGTMTEFDALKWTSLCSQRAALMERASDA